MLIYLPSKLLPHGLTAPRQKDNQMKLLHFISRIRQNISLFPLLSILLLASSAYGEIVDRIVASVNDDVITLSELEEQGNTYFQQVKEETPPESHVLAMQRAKMEVLEGLIERTLVAQKAAAMNISVSPAEVDNTYTMMVSKSGLGEEAFLEELRKTGHSKDSYQANLHSQILQSRLVNEDVRSKIVITEKMMHDYYQEKYMQKDMASGYHLLQMGFVWETSTNSPKDDKDLAAQKADAQKKAQQTLQLAKDGQDFKALAKKFSELPTAADGGDIGIFELDDMAPFMRDSVKDLKPGEISEIIETTMAYQFFKLLANLDGNARPFEEVKADIREELYEMKLNNEFDEWVKELKENAVIKRF